MDDQDKNRKEGAAPLPPPGGLRRSRSLRTTTPPPPSREGRANSGGSDWKRPRRQKEEEGAIGVQVNVQVSSEKVTEENGGLEEGNPGNGKALSNAGRTIGKLDKASGSSSVQTRSATRSLVAAGAGMKPDDRPQEEREAHPCLFIENVLDVIFKHLINQPGPRTVIANDVQRIRLVCKSWKSSITRLYRQTRPETEFVRYGHHWSSPRCKPLTSFVRTMKSSQMIPVQKFTFHEGTFHRKNLKMFREFLILCGPEVVELSISTMSNDAENIMLNLENLPDLDMRKLKSLHFGTYENHQRQDNFEEHAPFKFLELLLIAASTVREVRVDSNFPYYSESYRNQQGSVVHQLCLVIAKRISTTVKKLELKMDMNEAAFNGLSEMGATLEWFILRVPPRCRLGSRLMYRFLQSQATALMKLEFFSTSHSNDDVTAVVEFPQLEELVHLKLQEEIVSITCPSHFAETFPKLQSLKMSTESAVSALLSTVTKPSESLKVLDLGKRSFDCPAQLVKKVAQSFPCVAELHIGLSSACKDTMVEVFKYLDGLESLWISGFQLYQRSNWLDSIFSGIPELDCNRIGRLPEFGAVDVHELQRQPSIHNLTNLRKLVLEERPGSHLIAFTDVSAHFVFLEMESLRKIIMPTTAAQFSPRYLELLRDRLVLRG